MDHLSLLTRPQPVQGASVPNVWLHALPPLAVVTDSRTHSQKPPSESPHFNILKQKLPSFY